MRWRKKWWQYKELMVKLDIQNKVSCRWKCTEKQGQTCRKGILATTGYWFWGDIFLCYWIWNGKNNFSLGCSNEMVILSTWCQVILFEWWTWQERRFMLLNLKVSKLVAKRKMRTIWGRHFMGWNKRHTLGIAKSIPILFKIDLKGVKISLLCNWRSELTIICLYASMLMI